MGKKGRSPEEPRPSENRLGGFPSVYVAQDEDPTLHVEEELVGVLDEVPYHLGVLGRGPKYVLLGPVVQDELERELAGLAPLALVEVGVDVGYLPDLDRFLGLLLLGVLIAHLRAPPCPPHPTPAFLPPPTEEQAPGPWAMVEARATLEQAEELRRVLEDLGERLAGLAPWARLRCSEYFATYQGLLSGANRVNFHPLP
jgi:hypothetical protein